ncbi:hypothetical protein [Klebsiella aerogenes]|uniref:Uncharacterized protein n=1 Tax=Klebsiella aerogenes TaxID=548 RepID=A0AAP9U830_KLEAE|nr:hypothetical protein [Klebsiella aerogenes]QMR43116.1 hypothetical protein HV331_26965 [Klebsiella aerogenes]
MKKNISVTSLLASDDRTSAAKDSFVSEMNGDLDVSEKRCVTSVINGSVEVISTLRMKPSIYRTTSENILTNGLYISHA